MDFKYITVPKEISIFEVRKNKNCLSPSKYTRLLPDSNLEYDTLENLVILSKEKLKIEKGKKYLYHEIGNINVYTGYVDGSEYYGYFLPSSNPTKVIEDDIIISTVRTYRRGIGIIKKNENNLCSTPAALIIRKVDLRISKYYLLAILRSDFFIEQILGFQNKGMYPRLDKDTLKFVHIPIPKNNKIIEYLGILTKSLIKKEQEIRNRDKKIQDLIKLELETHQESNEFTYNNATLFDLKLNQRIDAGFYCEEHQRKIFKTKNYLHSYKSLDEQGMQAIPGPSLEIKLLGTRIDSDVEIKGFYRLITPKQISNYGTADYYQYIGTPKQIQSIQYGDILFGESGTGRSMVYLENHEKTINNAHAHILRPLKDECTLEHSIFVRCILSYYKNIGIIDYMTVGGQGGHLSPSYFDRIFIPNFPEKKQQEISKLYHNPITIKQFNNVTTENFEKLDEEFNINAGISELDFIAKKIRKQIDFIIDRLVKNENFDMNYDIFNA